MRIEHGSGEMVDSPMRQVNLSPRNAAEATWRGRFAARLRSLIYGECACGQQQASEYQPEFDREALINARPDLPPPGPDVIVRRW